MNPIYTDILKRYWGYDNFRPLQGEIIGSIAEGRDTLGLMPTGGGKSLTFQVPAMAMEGICLVVTPLIALMKDQVENLRRQDITAAAIYSGLARNEIIQILDNAVYGAYKFLYVSPERLATELFIQKISMMTVCLIAVDESHCISQWGYDFRPSYLRIAEVRAHLPGVPVLALTATARPEVVDDIQEKLGFAEKNVFRKSFQRNNLVYVVRTVDNKDENLLKILNAVPGTSVVYVRNRKRTKEVADFLNFNGITAEHFHAGLSNQTKDERQRRWKNNQTRVIVATNAFGMGIDKPEVRTVIHLDLPDSLEAYFQEAGRAGRDEKKAFAVLLFNKNDASKIRKRVSDAFPPKEMIVKVYEALGNYYQLGVGFGLDAVFPFDLYDFCARFKLPALQAYSSLKLLQQAGYIELTDEQDSSSRVMMTVLKDELYKTSHTPDQEKLLFILLRSYTGLFTEQSYINEDLLAKRLEWTRQKVYEQLSGLAKERVIHYIPQKRMPFITFIREREYSSRVFLGKEAYEDRLERYKNQTDSVLFYADTNKKCRSQILLSYFGEKDTEPCMKCDVCRYEIENKVTNDDFESIKEEVVRLLEKEEMTVNTLLSRLSHREQKVLAVLRFMMDNNLLIQAEQMKLRLVHKAP